MKRISALLLLMLAAGAPIVGAAQIVIKPGRLNFKGDSLGMSLAEYKAKHSGVCTDDIRDTDLDDEKAKARLARGLVDCAGNAMMVGHYAETAYKFLDGKLFMIFVKFPHLVFDDSLATARQKYGKEAGINTGQYQNYFGATFSGHQSAWVYRGDIVFLSEYMGDLKSSAMLMLDPTAAKVAKSREPVRPQF